MCLIGANSHNGRLRICVLLTTKFWKRQVWAGLEGLANLLLQQAEGLADFGRILVFICESLKTRRICSCWYGNSVNSVFVAKHRTRLRVFNRKPRFCEDESGTCCFEELCVWLGTVFPSLRSLPFSEFGRFGITNQTRPKFDRSIRETEVLRKLKKFFQILIISDKKSW